VKVSGGDKSRVSVKTNKDIPKNKIFDIMEEINKTSAHAPISIGDVIIRNVAGTGSDIIATGSAEVL
jgi:CxxC motif-containing protein